MTRKTICVQYETGKTKKVNGKSLPETRLLSVGSAFVNEKPDEQTGQVPFRINGQIRAIPPNWDGKFVLLDPLQRPQEDEDEPGI